MQMKSKSKKPRVSHDLPKLNLNAAGIDVGAESHYVAVPEGRANPCVREYRCYTSDLHALAAWLKDCNIETVAMESTGVYWIPVFQILDSMGFNVILVNPKYVKNVAGRKTDVLDCQWIQQLHTYGLLPSSFRPEHDICVLRNYWRHRDMLIKYAASHVQHMHKSLELMNLHIHKAISDITGATGMRIIRAILDGEHDPHVLAAMRDHRIKRDSAELAKALEGDYRPEHLFTLRQALSLYEFYLQQVAECDKQIEQFLIQLEELTSPNRSTSSTGVGTDDVKPRKRKRAGGHAPSFDLQSHLTILCGGVDITEIGGMNVVNALTVISETGTDMSKWPTEKHFCSWLALSPNSRISGGKVLTSRTRKIVSRAANAFRLAAQCLHNSSTALGAFFRRIKSRLGSKAAITATAHKIARIYYNMLKYGKSYVDQGQDYYEQRYQQRIIKRLRKKAGEMGFELVAYPQPAG
ncbi:MAG: IS110 family RNA-guided transposase [Armatimonadota bacterium]